MKKAKYTHKDILTCPHCGFEKPEGDGQMPEQVDIVSFGTNKTGETVYTCGNCGQEFIE